VLHIASLVSDPQKPALDDGLLARVAAALPAAGLPEWLAPGVAADIPFVPAGANLTAALGDARAALGHAPADLNFIAAEGRRKKLLLADMDSTMIEQECIDELADLVGKKDYVAKITERSMRGEIDIEPALIERVALLKGIPLSQIERLIEERLTLTPGAQTLVATMRAHGARTVLVSGGFTLFTGPVAKRIGFDEHRGNTLEIDGGRLTGTLKTPILGRDGKKKALVELRTKLGLGAGETLAVGDGANDLDMVREAGLGVAFRAKPALAAAADARIEHGDLTALLYLQGYRQDQFSGTRT
jgi:phosphoserine phosphatase